MKETIVVFSAHSDDFVIGAGGTIANYIAEGKKVISIIFSYGEQSHPWLKEHVVQKMRKGETLEACELLKCGSIFFDLKELKFYENYKEDKNIEKKLISLFNNYKPTKLFTHSAEDPHPDHKAVHKITLELLEKLTDAPETYIYSVWNPVSFKTNFPSFYVDVSKTFKLKLQAIKTFKSQKIHVAYPLFLLIFRAIKDGWHIRKKFGEHFFRIK